ncbi:MAG: AraC family transcriptional regulator [Phycisphaerae bacterium]|nr:AraC family transcriptional regulator [Phycisphaerae bacterium]
MPDPAFPFNIVVVEHEDDFPMHAHQYAELVIVLNGSAVHRTDLENYPIEAGDVFVITGCRRHGFSGATELRLCNIQFDPGQLLGDQSELEHMMGYHALFDLEARTPSDRGFSQRLRLDAAQMSAARSLIETMIAEFHGDAQGRRTIIRSTFLLLVASLCRLYTTQKRREPTAVVRMARSVAYMRAHFAEPLRVSDLARIAHLSPSQFQRTFRKAYGTTPLRFINQLRIERARELLADRTRSISAVAAETGFRSPAFFSTQFKRVTGTTPSAYRTKAQRDRVATWRIGPAATSLVT